VSDFLQEPWRRFGAWRAARKAALQPNLFVDVNANRGELKNMTDTRGPEFESGKKAFGAAHNLRVIGVIALIWALFILLAVALHVLFGWGWNTP
jgi:hypothetical protein